MTNAGLRIGPRADGSHVRVAIFIVNNRPETMERIRPHVKVGSSHDAAVPRGKSRVPGAAQHEVVRCRPGTVTVRGGHSLRRSRISDAPLHFVARCIASGTHKRRTRSEPYSLFKQPISFRRRISAPGVCNFASLTPSRGVGGAPRDVRVLGGTPVGPAHNAAGQALARRLASHDAGRSPLGAPPWRFWAPGAAASVSLGARRPTTAGSCLADPCSELLAPRS